MAGRFADCACEPVEGAGLGVNADLNEAPPWLEAGGARSRSLRRSRHLEDDVYALPHPVGDPRRVRANHGFNTEGARHVQALLIHIDDEYAAPAETSRKRNQEPDRPGPNDQHPLPFVHVGPSNVVASHCQRLDECPDVEGEL